MVCVRLKPILVYNNNNKNNTNELVREATATLFVHLLSGCTAAVTPEMYTMLSYN